MRLLPTPNGEIDLALTSSGQLAIEDTLVTAVIISLLSDRRANLDDKLPYLKQVTGPIPPDRRGWCGDALSEVSGDRIGSRLWLLSRAKQTDENLQLAIDCGNEALQWLIDDSKASSIDVAASWTAPGRMDMSVLITRPDGTTFATVVTIGAPYAI